MTSGNREPLLDGWVLKAVISIASTCIIMLLAIVAYFLKGVHGELQRVSNAVVEMSERISIQEERGRNTMQILNKDIDINRDRIRKLENKVFE